MTMHSAQSEMQVAICIFAFKREASLERLVTYLKENDHCDRYHLKVFCDGPRSAAEELATGRVVDYAKKINGFASVTVTASDTNMGLASSIRTGVTKTLQKHEAAIILEDDLVVSKNFLAYLKRSLLDTRHDASIVNVSAHSFRFPTWVTGEGRPLFLHKRTSSWGWAIWKEDWERIDFSRYDDKGIGFHILMACRLFLTAPDLPLMYLATIYGNTDSWAVKFVAEQQRLKVLTQFPVFAHSSNRGFDEHATHCEEDIGFEDRYDVSNPLHQTIEVNALSISANAYIWFRAGYNMCRRRANRILRRRGTSFA